MDINTKERFDVLDSFRGICAIIVVIYHINMLSGFSTIKFFREGSVFVEFFFVLSGFVLAHAYNSNKKLNFPAFILSRFFRIYPLHFAMFFVILAIEFVKLAAWKLGLPFNTPPFTFTSSPKEIIPNLLLIQAWTPLTESASFNGVSWSISIEFYTYIIFFVTLFLRGFYRLFLWSAIAAAMSYLLITDSESVMSLAARGLSCFFLGSISYFLSTGLRRGSKNNIDKRALSTAEALCLLLIIFLVNSDIEHKHFFLSIVFSCTVVVFSMGGGLISSILSGRLFLLLGKLSYSIYLTHTAILMMITFLFIAAQKISGRNIITIIDGVRHLDVGGSLANSVMVMLVVVSVILLSMASYKYIELPFIRKGKFFTASLKPEEKIS